MVWAPPAVGTERVRRPKTVDICTRAAVKGLWRQQAKPHPVFWGKYLLSHRTPLEGQRSSHRTPLEGQGSRLRMWEVIFGGMRGHNHNSNNRRMTRTLEGNC